MKKRSSWVAEDNQLFAGADDWWNNACLRYAGDDMLLYASGYKKAADLLVGRVNEIRRSQDFLVYPIVFLYRHHLELELKMIIRDGQNLLRIKPKSKPHHKLGQLWKEARHIIEKVWPNDSKLDLEAAEKLITQFEKVDPFSTAFRYDRDREGNPSLPKNLRHINLRHLAEVIAPLSSLLQGVNSGISYNLEIKSEMDDYYRP